MSDEIGTRTLAEIYLNQGNPRKALEIYREILKREPSDAEIREAIKSVKRRMAHSSQVHSTDRSQDSTTMERIKKLEKWLENIRGIRKHRENRGTH